MQILFNGMVSGSLIGLMAVSMAVVYLPTRVFHIALAGIYSLAPYLVLGLMKHGIPWWGAASIVIISSSFISICCEYINHGPLQKRGASESAHLISSLGIMMLIVQTIALIWGNDPMTLRPGSDVVWRVGGIIMTRAQLLGFFGAAGVLAIFYLWLRFSHLGLQFRALADDPIELGLWGYNVRRLRILAFGLSGAGTGAVSLLTALDLGFDPHGGLTVFLLAVVAAIIGGRTNFVGPLLGGIILGIMRSEVVWHLSARWQETITFLLLGLFLIFRPAGILGKRQRLEVES